jgi:aminoglycoside/choline kinase family phosphotransferase
LDSRQQALTAWLERELNEAIELQPVVGDASFRRYFRFNLQGQSYVAMDSPTELEDCRPFVELSESFIQAGVKVPKVLKADQALGFLLLEDFGEQLFHTYLNKMNANQLYGLAIAELPKIQKLDQQTELPEFAEQALQQELDNFSEWFLQRFLKIELSAEQEAVLQVTYQLLIDSALEQPQVAIHRDYHSRNLMLLEDETLGVLDFQDAAIGPITYDLVSLVRDCYIDWPEELIAQWLANFQQLLLMNDLLDESISLEELTYWFDLMGMQRHLKAIFIFARKSLRDGNSFYLQFIPRALNYVKAVAAKYPELEAFNQILIEQIIPAWESTKVPA